MNPLLAVGLTVTVLLSGCRNTEGLIKQGPFLTQDARALPESERSIMNQPKKGYVELEDAEGLPGKKWYWVYPAIAQPSQLIVTPGLHHFYYWGGHSWWECAFSVSMFPGHTYVPGSLKEPTGKVCYSDFGCMLEIVDRSPDGQDTKITVDCS